MQIATKEQSTLTYPWVWDPQDLRTKQEFAKLHMSSIEFQVC